MSYWEWTFVILLGCALVATWFFYHTLRVKAGKDQNKIGRWAQYKFTGTLFVIAWLGMGLKVAEWWIVYK